MEPDEEIRQPVRIHLPPHVRVLGAVGLDGRGRCGVRRRTHDVPCVVVDAEEVERRGDRLEVAVLDPRKDARVGLEHVARVPAAEHRVEEPAVAGPV